MDNLKTLKEQIERDIDPNGSAGSILALNHQNILKEVLEKVGKWSGAPFIAKKNATSFTPGTFSWNGNALNNTAQFTITTSKKTTDLNDFGLVLDTLGDGDIIRFKDFVGRSVMLRYKSHTTGTDGGGLNTYVITVEGFAENPSYIYQDTETAVAVLSINKTIGIKKNYVDDQDQIILDLSKQYTDAVFQASQKPFVASFTKNWVDGTLDFNPAGVWYFEGQKIEGTNAVTSSPGDATFDRIDVFALNRDGTITLIEGTPSADPVEPDVDPDTQINAGFIIVKAGATTPDGLSKSTIFNENTQVAGGEFDTTENTSGARINLGSTADAFSGTVSMEWTGVEQYDAGTFTPGSPIPATDVPEIELMVKNKTATNPENPFRIQVFGTRSNGKSVFDILDLPIENGYDPTLTTWQKVTFQFNNPQFENITSIRVVNYAETADAFGAFFDVIQYTTDTNDTPETPTTGTTEISIQNELGVEQFKITNAVRFGNSTFDPATKTITPIDTTGGGGSGSVISNIRSTSQTYLLTVANKDEIIRVDDYASIIVPSGLGLKFRTIIKRCTDKTVSLTPGENVVIEYPEGTVLQILSKYDAIELVCEKIDNGVEYWGVYGALTQAENILPLGLSVSQTSIQSDSLIYPSIYRSADFPEITTSKDYFMLYSSDHAITSQGGFYWGEMDDPEGLNFVERGAIRIGFQSETPILRRIPVANGGKGLYIFFHSQNEGTIPQETRLFTTPGGNQLHLCTFTDEGFPLTPQAGFNHTGYLTIHQRNDGTFVGHSLTTGEPTNRMGIWTSTDLENWTLVTNEADLTQGAPAGYQLSWRDRLWSFRRNGVDYVVWQAFFISGGQPGKTLLSTCDTNFMPTGTPIAEIPPYYGAYDNDTFIENDILYLFVYLDGSDGVGGADTGKAFINKIYLTELLP